MEGVQRQASPALVAAAALGALAPIILGVGGFAAYSKGYKKIGVGMGILAFASIVGNRR
jgi:hypothetical protein